MPTAILHTLAILAVAAVTVAAYWLRFRQLPDTENLKMFCFLAGCCALAICISTSGGHLWLALGCLGLFVVYDSHGESGEEKADHSSVEEADHHGEENRSSLKQL